MASRRLRNHKGTGRGKLGKIFGVFAMLVVIFTIIFGFVGYSVASSWLKDLPDYKNRDAFDNAEPTTILAADGSVLAKLYIENRESVSMEDMGPYLPKATVAVEDSRFYKHKGFDPIGIARAFVTNLTSGDSTGEGASTITQQYIRQTILRNEMYTKSYERKVREAYLAFELEKIYSKEEVLHMYLNTVYYGDGAYGAEVASKEMFGKSAKDLTLSEAALLAGLPQQPSRLNPHENLDGAIKRRDTVLRRMYEQGYINKGEYDAALKEKMVIKSSPTPQNGVYQAPYFVSHVKKLLQQQFSEGTVFAGGLTVQTTLQPKLQKAAEKSVSEHLEGKNNPDGALVSIDPKTGYVVALYGGKNFEQTKFNLATQAKRQPGSSFKMFTLVTALNEGMPPTFTLDSSSPANIKTDSGTWKVSNSGGGGRGAVTLRYATEQSLNTPFARLIVELGPSKVAQTAHEMGITSELSEVPSLTLGSSGVTPLEMASAFGPLATGGLHHDPVFITKVTDKEGKVLFEDDTKSERVVDPGVAYVATDILKGDITKGTGTRARIGRPAAGKTGTSQENRDAWFIGYTPDLVTSVWVGYSQERTGYVNGSLIWGGTICCPIWHDYMEVAIEGVPESDFPEAPEPKWNPDKFKELRKYSAPKKAPGVVGLSLEDAKSRLSGYTIVVVQEYNDSYEPGVVIGQGTSGNTVTLTVSLGPDPAKQQQREPEQQEPEQQPVPTPDPQPDPNPPVTPNRSP